MVKGSFFKTIKNFFHKNEEPSQKEAEFIFFVKRDKRAAAKKFAYYQSLNEACDLPAMAAKNVVDCASEAFKKSLDSDRYEGYCDKLCSAINELHSAEGELAQARDELNEYRNSDENNLNVFLKLQGAVNNKLAKYSSCVKYIRVDMDIDLPTAEAYFKKLTNTIEPIENIDNRKAYL